MDPRDLGRSYRPRGGRPPASGGNNALQSLQQASIIAAAPFLLVMIAMCYALFKELRAELLPQTREAPEPERAATRPSGAPAPQQTSATEPDSGR